MKKMIEEQKAYMQYVATKYITMLLNNGWSLALDSCRIDINKHNRLEPIVLVDPQGTERSVGWFEHEVASHSLEKSCVAYSVFLSPLTIEQQRCLMYGQGVETIDKIVECFAYHDSNEFIYFQDRQALEVHMKLREERYERKLPVSIYEKSIKTNLPGFKSATLKHQIRSQYNWRKRRHDLKGYYILVNKNGREMSVGSYEYRKLRKKVA